MHLTRASWNSSPCNCPGQISKRCGMALGGQGTGLVQKWASALFAAWVSDMAGSRTANISPVLQPTIALCFSHKQLPAYIVWMHKVTFAPPGFLRVTLPGSTCCAHTTENRRALIFTTPELPSASLCGIHQTKTWLVSHASKVMQLDTPLLGVFLKGFLTSQFNISLCIKAKSRWFNGKIVQATAWE